MQMPFDPDILKPGLEMTYVAEKPTVTKPMVNVDGEETGDIGTQGWLTTERINSYNQIVKADAFAWEGGLNRWHGRIMLGHGRRVLVGGGSDIPIGRIHNLEIRKGEGLYGKGFYYNENTPLLKRSLRDGTLRDWSIGFMLDKYDLDKKTKVLTITKARLFEVSAVDVGAQPDAKFEVLHSIREELISRDNPIDEPTTRLVRFHGKDWLVTSRGDIYNV